MFSSKLFSRSFGTSVVRLDTIAFIESAGGKIAPASLSTLSAAAQVGKPITAVVFGPGGESIAEEASKLAGVQKLLQVKGDQYNHYLSEELAPVLKEIIESKGFTHFFTSASAVGKSVLPRLGALLDSQPVSDITKVVDETTFIRPIYAGNALATVKSNESIILASVRASAFPPVETGSDAAPIEEFSAAAEPFSKTELTAEQLITSERPELGSAGRVVSGGRGLKDKENFEKLMEPLATKLNAAIGASRAAVDSGFCDNSLQVGQTGKIVAPELYVAVGISGAIQHLAGMKDSKTIVAINKDPEAPIFNVADIGLVGDLNEVVPELTEKL